MAKKDRSEKSSKKGSAIAPEKEIDPSLASLFESSFGAVKAPAKPARELPEEEPEDEESGEDADADADADADEDEDTNGDIGDVPDKNPVQDPSPAIEEEIESTIDRKKKRKRRDENEEIEDLYLRKLQDADDAAERKRKEKRSKTKEIGETKEIGGDKEGDNDKGDSDEDEEDKEVNKEFPMKHETLQSAKDIELEKSTRTVFLGNVPSTILSSKSNYKVLKAHFSTAGKITSVRFRSIAFSEQIPRKAAFITHKLHEKQQTLNAYIVFATPTAAREALKLNGHVILDRHIRVDSVAHPAPHDARRCVFVGNLDFEAQEESLWKHFAQSGKVESVRIVRDAKTNVGKGFAYVQFEDAMAVDEALLLNEKKMPNDRKLRVTRAKTIKRNAKRPSERDDPRGRRPDPASRRPADNKKGSIYQPKVDPRKRDVLGRATKLLGRAGAAQLKSQGDVFEGLRATAKTDSGIKKGGSGKKGGKPRARAAARASAWKGKQGKK